jgi:sugar phosphate isomerase/epimerase
MTHDNCTFGYCTNVHPGTTLEQAKQNLLTHASRVRELIVPQGCLPIGLWLAETAAQHLIHSGGTAEFGQWLADNRFTPYTFNGFPQGDFHQPVVKHSVYEPTWTCQSRAQYTMCLAEILDALLPAGGLGSISTLPLGWPHAPWHAENFKLAADNLLDVARFLDRYAQKSGKEIVIAIEPEPGCVLNTSEEMIEFFEHYLFSTPEEPIARRHLTICHDICHSGVMFESQVEALQRYRRAGVRIGKVQVSSAIHVPWDQATGDSAQQARIIAQLQTFNEPKYLHQTTQQVADNLPPRLSVDLPLALQHLTSASAPQLPWRIHFHVPIYVERFSDLETTRDDILQATQYVEQHRSDRVAGTDWFTGHYEVETYAWPVLPPELAVSDLAHGIAEELNYFDSLLKNIRG